MSLNDKYVDYNCVDCGDYYCISKWGGMCPNKQMELNFDTLKREDRDVRGESENG